MDTRDDDHDGSLQQLRDGTLICNYFIDIYYRMVDGKGRGNWWKIATLCPLEGSRQDVVETHRDRRPVELRFRHVGTCAGAGRRVLLMPVYGWEHTWAVAVRRPLQPRPRADLGRFRAHRGGHGEEDVRACLGEAPRRPPPLHERESKMCSTADGGRTWSKPQTIPFAGDVPGLLYTSKGLLLSPGATQERA